MQFKTYSKGLKGQQDKAQKLKKGQLGGEGGWGLFSRAFELRRGGGRAPLRIAEHKVHSSAHREVDRELSCTQGASVIRVLLGRRALFGIIFGRFTLPHRPRHNLNSGSQPPVDILFFLAVFLLEFTPPSIVGPPSQSIFLPHFWAAPQAP